APAPAPAPGTPGVLPGVIIGKPGALVTREFDLKDVQAFDTRGKKLDAKALKKALSKEVPALMSADGKPVDPLHLRLIKDGTVILVLPVPARVVPVPIKPLPPVPVKPGVLPVKPGGVAPGVPGAVPGAPPAVPGTAPAALPERP